MNEEIEIDSDVAYELIYYLRKYPYARNRSRARQVNDLMQEILSILYEDNQDFF